MRTRPRMLGWQPVLHPSTPLRISNFEGRLRRLYLTQLLHSALPDTMRSGLASLMWRTPWSCPLPKVPVPLLPVPCTKHEMFASEKKHQWQQCTALVTGMLLLCQPAQAFQLQQLALLDTGNTAILGDLKRLNKTRQRFGTQEPTSVLSGRFLDAQQQLQRIELLVKIGQYDHARMQLREGSFKSLRVDLAYGQEMYRVVKPEAVRAVVENSELLDRQLKRKEPASDIKPTLQSMKSQLADLAGLLRDVGQ